MPDNHLVHLALGSNLGDRGAYLNSAISALGQIPEISLGRQSTFVETDPIGPGAQNQYLNAALEINTKLSPHELLAAILQIEQQLGRIRDKKWGPRTIDLDILLFDDLMMSDENLTIPHPHLHERSFVLEPLNEIAAAVVHPQLNCTVAELLSRLNADQPSAETIVPSI